MYCPQCGTESQASLQYCRLCGANLKVIGKAVTLSEAIARSDRGPLPKLKEMVKNFKLEHVTDEISGALDKMNEEIMRSSGDSDAGRLKRKRGLEIESLVSRVKERKSQEKRRENLRVKGTIQFFTGIGLTIFLYNLLRVLVLKLPPDVLVRIPFDIEPVVRVLWTVGLIPTLSGAGRLAASFFIRPTPVNSLELMPAVLDPEPQPAQPVLASPEPRAQSSATTQVRPASVTEHTTELLSAKGARQL